MMRKVNLKYSAKYQIVAIALLTVCCRVASAEPARRNVLFIVADDLNCYLGAYGNTQVKSPNIDRLAEQGTLFTQAYSQFPVCGPSRSSFMTGLRPNTTGILSNGPSLFKQHPNVKTIASEFRRQGYVTARVGKIYNTIDNSETRDWDHLLKAPVDRSLLKNAEGEIIDAGHKHWNAEWRAPDCDDNQLPDGASAEAAAKWIGENKDKSFFLAVGFKKPHQPLIAPKKYFDLYDKNELHAAWIKYREEGIPDIARNTAGRKLEGGITEDQRLNYNRAYYATVSYIDAQVGTLMSALTANGLADNTLVVLFSDHGFHLGEHRTWGKNMLFEFSSRVPLIFAGPGTVEGQRCEQIAELVDLFPTLLEVCGLETVPELEGRSLATQLDGRGPEDLIGFTQVVNGWSVRTPQWRLINFDPENEGLLLYNVQEDPFELDNVAANPERAPLVQKLLEEGRNRGME
jgi:iduronate 2-sulfatase